MFNKSNMNKMLKQAQSMQFKMASVEEELNDIIIEESTADMLSVKMNGKLEVLDVQLSATAMEEEKDVLEDIIVTTINKTLRKAQDEAQSHMNAVASNTLSGLIIPGM